MICHVVISTNYTENGVSYLKIGDQFSAVHEPPQYKGVGWIITGDTIEGYVKETSAATIQKITLGTITGAFQQHGLSISVLNGVAKFWLNGVEIGSLSSAPLGGTGSNSGVFVFSVENGVDASSQVLYINSVEKWDR
jgi:hypothetical protein